jgi:hypothetical protein
VLRITDFWRLRWVAWGFVARWWFSEVVQQIMTDEARAKLRAELVVSEAVNTRRREDSR